MSRSATIRQQYPEIRELLLLPCVFHSSFGGAPTTGRAETWRNLHKANAFVNTADDRELAFI